MKHFLLVMTYRDSINFAFYWANDLEHALKQLDDNFEIGGVKIKNPRECVTFTFESETEIQKSLIFEE